MCPYTTPKFYQKNIKRAANSYQCGKVKLESNLDHKMVVLYRKVSFPKCLLTWNLKLRVHLLGPIHVKVWLITATLKSIGEHWTPRPWVVDSQGVLLLVHPHFEHDSARLEWIHTLLCLMLTVVQEAQ